MEDINLMDFCSPVGQTQPLSSGRSTLSNSPGSNPFDVLSKIAETFPSDSITDSFKFFDSSLNNIESIFNCGRESIGFSNMDEFGRESLGILKIDFLDTAIDDLISNVVSSGTALNSFNTSKAPTDTSLLNTAFLYPSSQCYKSAYLSNSSLSPNPLDFHSGSLEASEPSKIYSINSFQFSTNFDLLSKTENILNNAFISSLKNSLSLNEHEARLRLFSVPELDTVKRRVDFLLSKSYDYNDRKILLPGDSDAQPYKCDLEDGFNDSVFIEANHFTSKLADESILSIECFEDDLLDFTSPPEFPNEVEVSEAAEVKTENIFKCIDKMIPTTNDQIVIKSPNFLENCSNSAVESRSNDIRDLPVNDQNSCVIKQNLSNLFKRKSTSSSNSTSKDATELLHNLSEIIKNENRGLQQNLEGQKLLFGLADILCSSGNLQRPIDSLDDSGHSSIEHDEQQIEQQTENDYKCYEVLDLRVSKSTGNDKILDLSVKPKRISHSFSFPSSKVSPLPDNVKRKTSSASSASSLDSNKIINSFGSLKFKPKRVEENTVMKKGPLKAIIPIGNMSRHQNLSGRLSPVTPSRKEHGSSSLFKVKRTSTPIMEPKLKPMAQSTPDGPNLEFDKSKSSYTSPKVLNNVSSMLPKRTSIGQKSANNKSNKLSRLGSASNASDRPSLPSANLTRRHSESELRSSKPSVPLKRSYSIGKGSKVNNISTERTRHSVLGLKNTSDPIYKKSSAFEEKNRGIMSNITSSNLLSKMKKNKAGKENIHS